MRSKILLPVLLLALCVAPSVVVAQDAPATAPAATASAPAAVQAPAPKAHHKVAKKKLTPQQEKMKTCNKDAKSKMLKGKERKTFMSECLSAKAT